MAESRKYGKTLVACYLGFITQAIAANFAPLLFVTFQHTYGISLEKIALIPVVFYLTQLFVDLGATKFADKIGYRICVVASQIVSAIGLVLLAVLPEILPVPFLGILIAVVLYAIGSGLVEVLVSPIVEACPFENKDGMMSLLHSFYCWGAVGVILGSSLFFAVFGTENWRILTVLWALVPLVNVFLFLSCPMERLVEEGESLPLRKLLWLPLLWMMILLMICAGASEAAMAQWASAFTESALGVSKTVGDLAGPCLFALSMGISRMLYGKISGKLNLTKTMLLCGLLCVVCYLLASLSPLANSWLGRMRSLWFRCGHYVAGYHQSILSGMSERRYRDVRVFGLSGGFRRHSKPGSGGKHLGTGWRQSEDRAACGNSISCRAGARTGTSQKRCCETVKALARGDFISDTCGSMETKGNSSWRTKTYRPARFFHFTLLVAPD